VLVKPVPKPCRHLGQVVVRVVAEELAKKGAEERQHRRVQLSQGCPVPLGGRVHLHGSRWGCFLLQCRHQAAAGVLRFLESGFGLSEPLSLGGEEVLGSQDPFLGSGDRGAVLLGLLLQFRNGANLSREQDLGRRRVLGWGCLLLGGGRCSRGEGSAEGVCL
jgi:hypothetical protein